MNCDFILYSTDECHLCEQAKCLCDAANIAYQTQDIVNHDALMQAYAVRIPVLKRCDTNAELGWPFDAEQLEQFCR